MGANAGELCGMCREPMNEGAVKCAHCGATRVTALRSWVGNLWVLVFVAIALVGCVYVENNLGEWFSVMIGWLVVLFLLVKFGPKHTYYKSSV